MLDLGFANIQPVQSDTPNIKVIGIGGGGGAFMRRDGCLQERSLVAGLK